MYFFSILGWTNLRSIFSVGYTPRRISVQNFKSPPLLDYMLMYIKIRILIHHLGLTLEPCQLNNVRKESRLENCDELCQSCQLVSAV